MAEVDDWFAEHPVHETIASLAPAIEAGLQRDSSPDSTEKLNRCLRVARRAESILGNVDPELLPRDTVDSLNNQAQGLQNKLQAFADRGDTSQLDATAGDNNNALKVMSQLAVAYVPPTAEAIAEATTSFRYSAGQHVSNLGKEASEVRSDLESLRSEVQQTKESLDAERGRLDSALADFQKEFRASETDRVAQFQKETHAWQEEAKDTWNGMAEEFRDNSRERLEGFDAKVRAADGEVAALMERLGSLEDEAREAVSTTGEVVLTAGHAGSAANEKKAADWLRIVALILFVAAAGMAVLTLANSGELRWEQVLGRTVGIAALVVPALYAARESANHRQRERINRKMGLELAAIDPYLAHFSPEEKNQIKTELKDRFFGVPDHSSDSNETITAGGMYRLLERVLDQITKR